MVRPVEAAPILVQRHSAAFAAKALAYDVEELDSLLSLGANAILVGPEVLDQSCQVTLAVDHHLALQ
jgi:hypothetical protein